MEAVSHAIFVLKYVYGTWKLRFVGVLLFFPCEVIFRGLRFKALSVHKALMEIDCKVTLTVISALVVCNK